MKSEGYFLLRGTGRSPARLVREVFWLDGPTKNEVIAEPLFGCWEGNMGHSLSRRPIDICRHRSEDRVIIGNAGVVRVLEVGEDVNDLDCGDLAMLFPASVVDEHGYPEKMLGYDAPGTMGCMATRIRIRARELIKIPQDSKYSLAQWAAFSVRYVTAWSNWELAFGTYRLMVPSVERPCPYVWGWGGGTTLAELDLAQRNGCQSTMICGSQRSMIGAERCGLSVVDRSQFGDLNFDRHRLKRESEFRSLYHRAEESFLELVRCRTNGEGVHIFVDYIGSNVVNATIRALGRNSVVTSAGWKCGMIVEYQRAVECIGRHQFIHTHYANRRQAVAAMNYGEDFGWMPELDEKVWQFDDLPDLARAYDAQEVGMFPVFAINPG